MEVYRWRNSGIIFKPAANMLLLFWNILIRLGIL